MTKTQTRRPPVCRDYHIEIRRDGTWWHEGLPIRRHNLAVLFSRQLRREADGSYWLETPAERGPVTVEDLPFVVTAVDIGADEIRFETNCGDTVVLSPENALRLDEIGGEVRPAVHVRGDLWARVSRPVYYRLAAEAVASAADPSVLGVVSQGSFFALGRVGDET